MTRITRIFYLQNKRYLKKRIRENPRYPRHLRSQTLTERSEKI